VEKEKAHYNIFPFKINFAGMVEAKINGVCNTPLFRDDYFVIMNLILMCLCVN
jgi:hypothetical protein